MVLRPLRAADQTAFVAALEESRDAWAPWTPASTPGLPPDERFRRELHRGARGAVLGTHLRLGAFRRDDAGLVGLFALNDIVGGVFESAHASWQVRTSMMGLGFGTEGVRGLLDLAFQALPDGVGLHRVQANIIPRNEPSIRLARRVGFREEGKALRYLKIAGRWEDHLMFAVTREEWTPESSRVAGPAAVERS